MRGSRVVLWGRMPITRSSIPELLADLARWPMVDRSALNEKDANGYDKRVEAVRLFVEQHEVSMTEIGRRTTVHPEQLYRLLERCLRTHEDGRIQGFRGLLPYKHLKEYERRAKVGATKPRGHGGSAGALTMLLTRLPTLRSWLVRQAKTRNKPLREGEVREVRKTLRRLHKQFLVKCRELGVKDDEWPFNRDEMGFRSVQTFVYREQLTPASGDDVHDTDEPGDLGSDPVDLDAEGWPPAILPFDAVQFDGHKLDIRLTLRFIDPFGMESLFELTRIFILVCLDVATRAVLGYHIALSSEYDSDDVAHCLQACFGPHRAPKLTIPGLSVKEGGGFPSEHLEQTQQAGWRWFQYDNARANLADATLQRLCEIVGCYVHAGRLGEPNDRAFIERFFATLARLGLHQLPGTTGSSVSDVARRLADFGENLELAMTVDELEQVIEVMLADYNGESHGGLGGRSPLEAMRYWLSKPGVQIRSLPSAKRRNLIFLQEARIGTVRGKSSPYLNFLGVRYTSDVLSSKPELCGKNIRIYFNSQDIRQLHAFFEDGAELGLLVASRSWRRTAHSIRQRREILRLVRLGKVRYREGEDAVEAYALYKRRQARTSKKAANSLAELQKTQMQARDGGLASTPAPSCASPESAPSVPPESSLPGHDAAPPSELESTQETAKTGVETPVPGEAPRPKPNAKILSVRRTITF